MTTRLTYPSADTYAVFPLVDGGDVAIHSRNVCSVTPVDSMHTEISTADGVTRTVVAAFETVMLRLGGKEYP